MPFPAISMFNASNETLFGTVIMCLAENIVIRYLTLTKQGNEHRIKRKPKF